MRPASLPTAGRSSPRWPNNSPSIIKPAHPECLHRQLVQPHRLSRDQRPISFNGCPHKRNRRVHSVGFWRGFPSRPSGPQTLSGTRLAASLSDVGARSMDSPRSFSRKWGGNQDAGWRQHSANAGNVNGTSDNDFANNAHVLLHDLFRAWLRLPAPSAWTFSPTASCQSITLTHSQPSSFHRGKTTIATAGTITYAVLGFIPRAIAAADWRVSSV